MKAASSLLSFEMPLRWKASDGNWECPFQREIHDAYWQLVKEMSGKEGSNQSGL
jgi:hypothetical protein